MCIGVKSIARRKVLDGREVAPKPSGFAAFRATVPAEKLRADPELAWLVEKAGQHLWIGPDRHVMSYCIAGGSSFNMVINYVDHSDPSTWQKGKEIEEMRAVFHGWDPKYARLGRRKELFADIISDSQE